MRRRLRIARRTIGSLRSEKTILLAIAIQLFVAAFSSFMVVGLVSLTDPGATEGGYEVDMAVSGNASDDLLAAVDSGESRDAMEFESRESAVIALSNGRVDGVLHAEYIERGRIHVDAVAPEGDFETTLVVVEMKDALGEFERQKRIAMSHRLTRQPLAVPEPPQSNPYFEFTYTVLIPVLAFLPAFISGSITADSLAEEIERGTLELLRVAPVTPAQIVDGKALAMVAIAPAQAALWLGLLAFDGTSIARPGAILLLVLATTTILVTLGAGLALLIRRRAEAQLLYSLTALALFGLALFAPEGPPAAIAKLAVGTATPITDATVIASFVVAVGAYWGLRTVLDRTVSLE
ncbi:ABC-type Na+ efflux pump, permease component [Halanaeroarchaeum sp. HSR-CO]|uniref:ABC transporter permease n=1 Tax=Halanaeroarchaeum sp. HSR-CO TaxID=2866382 RepID=UPI00217E9CE1|nr:ABC transporter permease [Halanaeroarchaeum sp. HSR-CO]UWG47640.1 ABC-type Na+ efflux pump, permease component [Halanaeroarchaeum sp. HSR-CO]